MRFPSKADEKQPTSILATGINWLPTGELLSALTRENLLYKEMLLNLIPSFIVEKLLQQKVVQPKAYRDCSVMFADVVSFSKIAFHLDPVSLLRRLDQYFSAMDRAARPFLIEKSRRSGTHTWRFQEFRIDVLPTRSMRRCRCSTCLRRSSGLRRRHRWWGRLM